MTDERAVIPCPRCARGRYVSYDADPAEQQVAMMQGIMPPALSRADNATYICSYCGTDEALIQWARQPLQMPSEWPVDRSPIPKEGE